jgi:hypothetical protein
VIYSRLTAALGVLLVSGLGLAGCGSNGGGDSTGAQGSVTSPESGFQNSDSGQAPNGRSLAVMQIKNKTQYTLELSGSNFTPNPKAVSPARRIEPNNSASTRIEWDGAPNHFVAVLDYKAQDASGKTVGEIRSSVLLEGSAGHYTRTNHAEVKQGPLAVQWGNDGRDPLSPPGFGAWTVVTAK